jgi:hypothetical protein
MTAGEKFVADGLTAHTGNKGVNGFADICRERLII